MGLALTALSYARLGWRVLPLHHVQADNSCSCGRISCRPGGKEAKSIGKHPRLPSWQKDATTDTFVISAWWARWPQANVGIATGAASGLLVLDVDVHNNAPGFASLAMLERELGPLPRTRRQATGSGGQHIVFKYPIGIEICNSAGWRGFPGIDWRGNGGQIVVSPSVTLAGTYTWSDLSDVAELPPAWIEAHRTYETERPKKKSARDTALHPPAPPSTPPSPPSAEDLEADDAVIENARTAANGDKFNILWAGQWQKAGYESQSNADLALCSILSFWCDWDNIEPDFDRVDRLFQRSGLYRDKWDRQDYKDRTILIAIDNERERRENDAAFTELVIGSSGAVIPSPPSTPSPPMPPSCYADTVAAEKATLAADMAPMPPAPPQAVSGSITTAQIRQIVRKKRNAEGVQSKFDADLIENFMAGEKLVTDNEAGKFPQLAKFDGEEGLMRVAWILGNNVRRDVPWDAIVNMRPQGSRVPFSREILAKAGLKFEAAKKKKIDYDTKKEMEKEAERAAFRERARTYGARVKARKAGQP